MAASGKLAKLAVPRALTQDRIFCSPARADTVRTGLRLRYTFFFDGDWAQTTDQCTRHIPSGSRRKPAM